MKNESLINCISEGLAKLVAGDPVVVVYSLGYPHQKNYAATIERLTNTQIIVEGRRYDKKGFELGGGSQIFPDESLIEWAILRQKAILLKERIYDASPEALKDIITAFEKHGYLSNSK